MNFSTVPIIILVSFCITMGELYLRETPEETNGSISGVVVLAPKNSPARFGGGLYGRGASTSSSASPATDSVLIVLTSSQRTNTTPKEEPVILDQKDNSFVPNLLPIKKNQVVRIRNSDPVYHNVFSLSSTKKFDVGRRPRGEYLEVKFEKQGIVDVFCDIHSSMHAVIYVMPDDAVKWVKIQGGELFNLEAVPPGDYELKIYARGYEEISMPVEITTGQNLQLGTLTLNS